MKEMTWIEAIFATKGLKEIRGTEVIVPQEYINSTRKLALSGMLWALCGGIAIGYIIGVTL